MRPRVYWMALCGLLGVLPILPIWWRGNPLLINDMLVAYYCYFEDFHRNGSLANLIPAWSSSYQTGMPMHGYWQSGALYPITWILFGPFSPLNTIYLFYALHFALAVAGFLVLGPQLGLIRIASLWGGIAFGLSGTMLGRYEHPTFLSGWSYLPLLLGLFLALEKKPSVKLFLGLTLALVLQTVGGHPQATMATAVLLGGFFLRGFFVRSNSWKKKSMPLAAGILAGILCLPLFIPFLDFLGQTDRYDGSAWEGAAPAETGAGAGTKLSGGVFRFDKFATGALRPAHLMSLVLPRALGTPAHASWWGGEPWSEVFLFIGSAGFLGCFFFSFRRSSPRLRWLLLFGLIGLWFAFGAYFFAAHLLYPIPGINNFRRPARWDILFVLALSALSAQGFQQWLGGKNRIKALKGVMALAGAGFLIAGALSWFPGVSTRLIDWVKVIKTLDSSKNYSSKILTLVQDWRTDFAFLFLTAMVLLLRSKISVRRLILPLFFLLLLDLLRLHWQNFYAFPRDFYRTPPRTLASLDLSTQPFWRVDTYLEYPGTEMWQMHHAPLLRPDLYEREKLALSYGVHALFGIKHVGAHMPLLWPWDKAMTPGEKSARYLLSNRELKTHHGSPLRKFARYDSVWVYEVQDWKPRLEWRQSKPTITPYGGIQCSAGYSLWGQLCASEPRDGWVRMEGGFQAGDTLIFREHWHRGWRVRVEGGEWQNPLQCKSVFMSTVIPRPAGRVEWKFSYR